MSGPIIIFPPPPPARRRDCVVVEGKRYCEVDAGLSKGFGVGLLVMLVWLVSIPILLRKGHDRAAFTVLLGVPLVGLLGLAVYALVFGT